MLLGATALLLSAAIAVAGAEVPEAESALPIAVAEALPIMVAEFAMPMGYEADLPITVAEVALPITDLVRHPLSASPVAPGEWPPFLALENRIGFKFASLCLGDDDGTDSTIAGSYGRIEALAEYLTGEAGAGLSVHIDGHVGISCPLPRECAFSYSEARAVLVADALARSGVCPHRISVAGWGREATERALQSSHPNARSAQAGFGWAEVFLRAADGTEWPARPDYYRHASPPPPSPPPARRSVPIFYMQPGLEVGERFGLHFFEPRYQLLAARIAADASPEFLYCAAMPFTGLRSSLFNLPRGAAAADSCVLARCDSLRIHDDGTADCRGVGLEEVALTDVQLEEGSGGLFSASIPAKVVRDAAALAEARKEVTHPCAAELSRCAAELGVAAGDGGECLLSHFESLSGECRAFVAAHLTPRLSGGEEEDEEGGEAPLAGEAALDVELASDTRSWWTPPYLIHSTAAHVPMAALLLAIAFGAVLLPAVACLVGLLRAAWPRRAKLVPAVPPTLAPIVLSSVAALSIPIAPPAKDKGAPAERLSGVSA